MGIPNIPSVTTSVIDQTSTEVSLVGGRVPFIPLFSKFGKGFRYCTTPKELKFYHGAIDVNRYGLGMEYANDAFQYTNSVLTYRLISPDAAFANYCISVDKTHYNPEVYNQIVDEALPDTNVNKRIKVSTFEKVNSKDEYIAHIDTNYKDTGNNKKIAFSILAQAQGQGYNDLFTTFGPAVDYEKLDANREGETNYKFNFIRANIFEDSSGIVKSMGDSFVFSLIDQDADTGRIITDMYSGEELFVNQISKLKNEFLTFAVDIDTDDDLASTTIREEMRKYATIDKLLAAKSQPNRLILIDDITGLKYEIQCSGQIVAQSNGTTKMVYKASRVVKPSNFPYNSSDFIQYIRYTTSTSSVDLYAELKWVLDPTDPTGTNYVLGYVNCANPNPTGTIPTVRYLDGDNAYYQVSIDTDGILQFEQVGFLRWYVYNYLLTHNIRLESGSDDDDNSGANLSLFNSAGYLYLPTNATDCKARDIVTKFFNETTEIREVLYPRYDFDYVPDWTNNIDVINAIVNFGDSIGITMPLVSLPPYGYNIGTNTDNDKAAAFDLDLRNSLVSNSSYNTMLYGSQVNKMHISNNDGRRLRMPISYYAMMAHLRIDRDYSITEPVANMIKGTLMGTSRKNLAYAPSSEKIEKLRNVQINAVIDEPDGLYIIDQLTMYKKASKLSRGNVVKVLHRMRKDLPKILKDLIQSKETAGIIDIALERTYTYLNKYVVTPENYKNGIFRTINVSATYNSDTYTLRLGVTVNPIGTIEIIDIPIIVI